MEAKVGDAQAVHEFIRLERNGDVATITLDRPGTRNACSMDMWLVIRDCFFELTASDARVIVITGANGDFCSGADVVKKSEGSSGFENNQLTALRLLSQTVLAIHDCPIPVVAKVDGYAVGAGLGLALAADFIWCSDRAKFSAIFAKLGLSLDFGASRLLAERVGIPIAKELAYTADMVDAERAERIGLVNRVVPADELDAAVDGLTARIAAGPPLALSMTKRMLDHGPGSTLLHALETEALAGIVNLGSQDLVEGMTAFREKRAPRFQGR
jgi:2-(1,2-epoxy-1,2-dihydrophenyl)acetyl-CoA isomerase